jgi:hypothetical protein
MNRSIEGNNGTNTSPLFDGISSVNGMVVGLCYKVKAIAWGGVGEQNADPLKVGERVGLYYDFQPYEDCMLGWETISLIACRKGRNYVHYFSSMTDAQKAIAGLELELDKDFARERIAEWERKIAQVKSAYGLE